MMIEYRKADIADAELLISVCLGQNKIALKH